MPTAEKTLSRDDVNIKILAQVIHELSPQMTLEECENHVRTTAHDPAKFFGDNGEGLAEYNAFVSTYDKDSYEKRNKLKKSKILRGGM